MRAMLQDLDPEPNAVFKPCLMLVGRVWLGLNRKAAMYCRK
jgi:hypothetical protein